MRCNKTSSGVYAPSYYSEFRCTADKCKHSCCIDWEICIDGTAYEKYKQIEDIIKTVKVDDDGPCFVLRKDGRCPHLNDKGLCSIIISHGEDYLCDICKKHPRFFNYMKGGRTEAGLGIVCEEACRLILENETPFFLLKTDWICDGAESEMCDFDALPIRDRIISVIEGDGGFDEKLAVLKNQFKISEIYSAEQWRKHFSELEELDPLWKKDLRSMRGKFLKTGNAGIPNFEKYYERLLTYFVYRHVSAANGTENLAARLAFCILSVQVIRSLFETETDQTLEKLIDWARRYSAEIEYSEDNTDELIFDFQSDFLS